MVFGLTFGREARIITLLVIDVAFFFVEIIVGYAVGSLALVADSFHMLNDVMSLVVALYAVKLSTQSQKNAKYSYGWQRAEILGALINGVFLLALCFSIFMEAIERVVNITEVSNPRLVVIVGSLGLASNIIGLFLFHDHGHSHGGHSHSHGGHNHGPAETGHSHHLTTAADHSDSSETTAAGDGVTAKPVRRRVSAATKGKGDDRSSNEDGVEDAETSGTNERSRERASSVSSLYGHPAQTRAYVVQAAHDMGYDPRGPPHIQGGERGRLLERGRTGSAGAGEYGTIADTNHAAKTHDHAHDHSHGDHDHDHAHEDVEAGGKSATKTSRGWFGQKKVVAEDDDDHLPSATSAVAHSPAAGHGHSHGHSHGEGSMNMRGVFLHVLGDALGNVGVIGSGLFILLTSYSWRFYTDPLISFIITIIIFSSALPLVKSASFILLQGVPATVPLDTVKESMQNVSGVLSIHELHIWQLSESKIVASVHVLVECSSAQTERYMDIATEIRRVLHSWGVHSSTIQPEFVPGGIRQAARMSGVDLSQTEVDEHGRLITGDGTLIESELSRNETACLLACDEDGSCVDGACCPPPSGSALQSRRGSNQGSPEDHSHGEEGHRH